jgi:hypothetical protein
MHIDWASLVEVGVVAAAAAATVVLLVSFALVGLSARPGQQSEGGHDHPSVAGAAVGRAVAVLCLVTAGLVVGYGLYTIVA